MTLYDKFFIAKIVIVGILFIITGFAIVKVNKK